jgi:dihydrodipicolinate synthase/N-acetylneuraminate lyase
MDGAGVLVASSILLPSRLGFGSVHVGAPMKPEELRARLRGVIAFPITPLKPDLSLDIPGLRKILQRLRDHTVVAIVAAGGTGEMHSLTPNQEQMWRHCRGRGKVLFRTGSAIDNSRAAVRVGAAPHL